MKELEKILNEKDGSFNVRAWFISSDYWIVKKLTERKISLSEMRCWKIIL